jgi:hypothetical protein
MYDIVRRVNTIRAVSWLTIMSSISFSLYLSFMFIDWIEKSWEKSFNAQSSMFISYSIDIWIKSSSSKSPLSILNTTRSFVSVCMLFYRDRNEERDYRWIERVWHQRSNRWLHCCLCSTTREQCPFSADHTHTHILLFLFLLMFVSVMRNVFFLPACV